MTIKETSLEAEVERLGVLVRHYERGMWLIHGMGPISAEKYAANVAGEALKGPTAADYGAVFDPVKDMSFTDKGQPASSEESERVIDVVDRNYNKIGETYDCGEPGCCRPWNDDASQLPGTPQEGGNG